MKQTMGMWVGTGGFVMMCLVAALSVQSATVTWNVTSGGMWDTTSDNWSGGFPVATRYIEGDNAVFTGAVNQTILVQSGGVTPGSLLFSNTANTITLAPATGATGFLNAGAGTFTKNGAGTVVVTQGIFAATAASHGGTVVNAGMLQILPVLSGTTTNGFGRGTITVNGGVFAAAPSPASWYTFALTNAVAVTVASTLENDTKSYSQYMGPLLLGGDLTLNGYPVALMGPITVSGASRTIKMTGGNGCTMEIDGAVTGSGGNALTIDSFSYQSAGVPLTGSFSNLASLTFLGDNNFASTRVTGNNSGFTGSVHIAASSGSTELGHMLAFSNAAAFGNPAAVLVDNRGIAGFEYAVPNATISNLFTFGPGGGIGAAGTNGTLTGIVNPSDRLSAGGRIYLDNDLGINQNRWGDSDKIALSGGNLFFRGNGNSKAAIQEHVGPLTFDYGCTAMLVGEYSTNTLTAASMARPAGSHGMLLIDFSDGNGNLSLGGTTKFMADAGLATSNGIVAPYIMRVAHAANYTISDVSFLNYAANGFTNATFSSTDLTSAGLNDVVDSGAVTIGGDRSVYALRLTGAVTSSVASATVTVRSGGLICKGGSAHYANFTFGDGGQTEAVVYCYADCTLAGNVTASCLTKAGGGILAISASNSITGNFTVDQGSLTLNYAGIVSTNNVAIGYGAILVISAPVAMGAADIHIGGLSGQPNSQVQGNNNKTRTLVIHPPAGSVSTFSGNITFVSVQHANLGLTMAGLGTQVLAGVSDYNMPTIVSNGTLVVAASGGLPATPTITIVSNAAFFYNASTLPLTNGVVALSGATVGGSGVIYTPLTITNTVHLSPGYGPGTLTVSNLTLTGGALYDWEWGGKTNYDSVTVLNQLTLTAGTTNTIRLFAPTGKQPTAGSYPILTWSGSTPPSTSVTWLVSKPAGGGAEGWSTPTVRMDTANKQILLAFPNMGTSILFR